LGGECHGLAFRLAANLVDRETEILWMREMIGHGYTPVFRPVLTPQGPVEALAFVVDRSSPEFADVSGAEAATIIAAGRGRLGTNREYFDNLAEHVRLLGIEDNVFEEIRSELGRLP
ncbi:MAG: gamma-glutamylcyclotransferase, partial [Rhodomicrobium sp.]